MKKKLLTIFLIINAVNAFCQTLNLPPRSATALTGSQFVATISSGSLSLTSRENMIYTEVSNGNVPSFYRNLVPVTSTATIGGVSQSVTYYVIPDYLAIGTDTNYFLCPMSPMLATDIADLTGCTLPTRKMVNDIWSAATVKLAPSPITASPAMTTVPVFDDHNTIVKGQRNAIVGTYPLGNLVSGDKKDVVISNKIYLTPNMVVIYGWHQTNGTPIQPLSNVHADTYMDYSHGIRLIQNAVVYNGTNTTIKDILQSSTLNPLLSDEGTMTNPQYPYNTAITSLNKPISFAVTRLSASSIKIFVSSDANASHYKVYTSTDGITFGAPSTLIKTGLQLTGLTTNQIYFVKIAAYDQADNITSSTSEVLAATTSSGSDSVLIVNGFDRVITGNTYDFIKQHGKAIWNKQKGFSSCTNEALTSGLINIQNYFAADYILGEESSTNETFSTGEQTLIKQYLKSGGNLFVSGSEIGWDLDHLGSTSDKDFYNNYLMASYIYDAPNAGTANSCYIASANGTFYSVNSSQFDNGTNGTYNVSYPDVIAPTGSATGDLKYCTNSEFSAIHYSGMFPSGTSSAKLVHWSFPFETVNVLTDRNDMMGTIIDYFFTSSLATSIDESSIEKFSVYPNPSSGVFTIKTLNNTIGKTLTIIDMTGRIVFNRMIENDLETIDVSELYTGIYILNIGSGSQRIIICK